MTKSGALSSKMTKNHKKVARPLPKMRKRADLGLSSQFCINSCSLLKITKTFCAQFKNDKTFCSGAENSDLQKFVDFAENR